MVTVREILRGAFTRFLPAAGGGALAILLAFDGRNVAAIQPAGWALFAGLLLAQTVGFATLLWRLRFRLEVTAGVAGRRSVVAGALGIVGLFVESIFAQGASTGSAILMGVAAGAGAGVLTFWPWMRRRVSASELAEWEGVDVEALAGPLAPPVSASARQPLRVERLDRDA